MMENIDTLLISYFLKGIPECVALTILTISILKLKYDWKKILASGLAVATIVLVARAFFLSSGLHTALAVVSMSLLVAYFYKVSRLLSIIASIISILILAVCELLVFYFFKTFFDVNVLDSAQNRLMWVVNSWITILILVLISLSIKRIHHRTPYKQNDFKAR